jgi:DNA end-binding protein Ku
VRTIEDVEIPEAPVRDAELTLAQQLIAQISSPTFDPTKYEDDVKKRIETAIEQKLEGQEIAVSPSVPEPGRPGDRPDGGIEGEPRQDAGEATRRQSTHRGCGEAPAELKAVPKKSPKKTAEADEAPVQKRKAGRRS